MKRLGFRQCIILVAALVLAVGASNAGVEEPVMPTKTRGVFFPADLVQRIRGNAEKYPWAREIRDEIVARAEPWVKLSDDDLWSMMFGPTITRSWMVWSNGYCPSCKKSVPMYDWKMDLWGRPWKVSCPHCDEQFPKNDFHAYYLSGLDEHGVFDPKLADRSLLFNMEHPDPKDPLHLFGVDDGEGYVEGEHRWRFIGNYLVFGQWHGVTSAVGSLADAYTVTGDPVYAHKAGVLLDRVADLYPTFDFAKQGLAYEVVQPDAAGYVTTWHNACEDTHWLASAYDQVFDCIKRDSTLVSFLVEKARRYHLDNPKTSFADIQRNVEVRILRDALAHQDKIKSNYPRTEYTVATLKTVLGWPGNREEVFALLGEILDQSSAVDGVSGEKGLTGYSATAPRSVISLLGRYARLEPGFLKEALERHPQLRQTLRFHIDMQCLGRYYPNSGDAGGFAGPNERYSPIVYLDPREISCSVYSFLWEWYRLTGDPAYVQVLYRANGDSVEGLPYDITASDPEALQQGVAEVIAKYGPRPKLGSVNKEQWRLAILRSGEGKDARALWLDYDAGGGHRHADAMNLGLYAKGLDLMPDFGYPPVEYGGWGSPRAEWYMTTSSHNLVVVDGDRQRSGWPPNSVYDGTTTLWADGERFRAIRASVPEIYGGKQYERTAALVDISDTDAYVLDIFRVVGGKDHAKFMGSHFGTISTQGLNLQPIPDYGHETQTRSFRGDAHPQPGWSVDWKVEDRHELLAPGTEVHLRYIDLTSGAQGAVAEGWVNDTWIPRVMVRRQSDTGNLASTFVAVIEPYEEQSNLGAIRRLEVRNERGEVLRDNVAAVEVGLADGRKDLLIATDVENPAGLTAAKTVAIRAWTAKTDAELALARTNARGEVERIALCRGREMSVGDVDVRLKGITDLVELTFERGEAKVVHGSAAEVESVRLKGRPLRVRG